MSIQPWHEGREGADLMDRIDGRLPYQVRAQAVQMIKPKPKPKPVAFRIDYRQARKPCPSMLRFWVRQAARIAERVVGVPHGLVISSNTDRFTVVPARLATIHAARRRWPSCKLTSLGRILGRNHSTIHHALRQDPVDREFDYIINIIMQEIGSYE